MPPQRDCTRPRRWRPRLPTVRRGRSALVALAVATGLATGLGGACTQQSEPPPDEQPPRGVQTKPAADTTMPDPSASSSDLPSPLPSDGTLPIEEVAKYPLPGTAIPGAFRFSPDGKWLTYLDSPDRSLTRQLYVEPVDGSAPRRVMFEPPEGGATEDNLSAEEKLQRERRRERALGVTRYAWAEKGLRVLVPLRGDLWVQDGPDGQP
ncbi:MAG: hypothetical protein AB1Z98_28475, partial [Nannocystaceae bacterium]